MLTDEQIIAQVCAGDLEMFGLLIRRHESRVHRVARAILHDHAEAEDVAQDTFVRAYEHLDAFEGRARFSTWLTRIAVHEALARLRKRERFESFDPRMLASSTLSTMQPTPEQHVADAELRVALGTAMETLSANFRAAFVLRAVDGMTGTEAADALGVPEQTVRTRAFRARGQLQQLLLGQRC